jgi:L-ribulose-5-phosphate 4-epimerase
VNRALKSEGLVAAHAGNASGLDPDSGVLWIKPSGFDYESLTPDTLAAVSSQTGEPVSQGLRPSVDLPHHLFLYRNLPGIRGVVHTHSPYATAFAALERPIPCVLTSIADVFGGDVPCAPYVDNAGDNIGRAILAHRSERSPAILLAHHGVFAWGESPAAALKAAVMAEDAARTVLMAMLIGAPQRLPDEEIQSWWDRYQNRYGQR